MAPTAGAQPDEVHTWKQRIRETSFTVSLGEENILGTLPGDLHVLEVEVSRNAGADFSRASVSSFVCSGPAKCKLVSSEPVNSNLRVRLARDRSAARVRGTIAGKKVAIALPAITTPSKVRSVDYLEHDGYFTKQVTRSKRWQADVTGTIGDYDLADAQVAAGYFEAGTYTLTTNDPTDDIPDDA